MFDRFLQGLLMDEAGGEDAGGGGSAAVADAPLTGGGTDTGFNINDIDSELAAPAWRHHR